MTQRPYRAGSRTANNDASGSDASGSDAPRTARFGRAALLCSLALLLACGSSDPTASGDGEPDAISEDTDGLDGPTDAPDDSAGDPDADADGSATDAGRDPVTDGSADSSGTDAAADAGPDTDPDDAAEPTPDTSDSDARGEMDGGPRERCSGVAPVVFGPELVPGAAWTAVDVAACTEAATAMVVPSGARWEIQALGLPADARVFVYGPSFRAREARGELRVDPIARTDFAGESGELALSFVAPTTGEYVALYDRDAPGDPSTVSARVVCREGCALEATRYPVVLVHGYAGVDSYFGLLDYFYDIHDPLEAAGYDVFTPVTDPVATSERRAEQLAGQVDEILRQTGAAKVNIIAHSQGGLDARLLVAGRGYGDRVASITTVATPHRGIPTLLGDFFSAQSFSPRTLEEFNARYPDHPDVRYWSWSARTCGVLAFGCQRASGGEVVDAFLVAAHVALSRFGDNDGVVPTESMPWGEHLGLLYADHFDEVGQIADGSPSWDAFDHRAFYRSEVRRLAAAGL